MADDESLRELNVLARAHVDAGRFDQAEIVFRNLIDQTDRDDHGRRWIEFVGLASTLNMLNRTDEGTDAYRRALAEAQQLPPGSKEVDAAKYRLGNSASCSANPRMRWTP
jgi:hypothetical protein